MLEMNSRAALAGPAMNQANQQHRRLLVALTLLLVALAVVLVKDRDFWFGSDDATDSEAASSESFTKAAAVAVPAKTGEAPASRAVIAKNRIASKTATELAAQETLNQETFHKETLHKDAAAQDSPVVATSRVVLPPLDVEVVAGDTHRTVHPGSSFAKVQIASDSTRNSTVSASDVTLPSNAAEREHLSTASIPEQTVDASYPLLGQHARVQGSVVLQAVVGADGTIEDLRVLSGPAILTAAAQQAVRQWRFKPYLQNGQPVETKARITVNFSIRISNNPANAS